MPMRVRVFFSVSQLSRNSKKMTLCWIRSDPCGARRNRYAISRRNAPKLRNLTIGSHIWFMYSVLAYIWTSRSCRGTRFDILAQDRISTASSCCRLRDGFFDFNPSEHHLLKNTCYIDSQKSFEAEGSFFHWITIVAKEARAHTTSFLCSPLSSVRIW